MRTSSDQHRRPPKKSIHIDTIPIHNVRSDANTSLYEHKPAFLVECILSCGDPVPPPGTIFRRRAAHRRVSSALHQSLPQWNLCSHFLNPVFSVRLSFIMAIFLSFSLCLASSSAVGLSSRYHSLDSP